MISYLTLSDLPQREKEKVMLLLAAADDDAWHPIHSSQHRLCIEWQLTSNHPALSYLPLRKNHTACSQFSPLLWDCNVAHSRHHHVHYQQQQQQRQEGPSRLQHSTLSERGQLSSQKGSSCYNHRLSADRSPWTSDWNNDGNDSTDQLPSFNISHSSAHNVSPVAKRQQRRQVDTARGATGRHGRSLSLCEVEDTPILNAQSTFLRRRSTPQRPWSSALRATSSGRRGSHWDDGRRRNPAPNTTSYMNESFVRSTAVRSAQWVSRLLEDVMSYVAKMTMIDGQQVGSVAALTVNVLKARYGALQWNRALKELAQGLHSYHSISPLCRVFREMFVDETTYALEDFFLFSQLYRAVLKYGVVETQKVIIPSTEIEKGAPHFLIQHTIVSRRYVELRLLTAALNDMLTAVSVTDDRGMDSVSLVRRRKLRPAEMIGTKTVVAYWVEEESANVESLAFDLGGFVDMYELLDVVVSALGSVRRRRPVLNKKAHERSRLEKNDVGLPQGMETPKEMFIREGEQAVSYAERARSILKSQSSEPENINKSVENIYSIPPALDMLRPSTERPNSLAGRKEEAKVPLTGRSGLHRGRYELSQHTSHQPDILPRRNEVSHVLSKGNSFGDEQRSGDCMNVHDGACKTTLQPSLKQPLGDGDPFVVDLSCRSTVLNGEPLATQCTSTDVSRKGNLDAHKTSIDLRPQQYFAALASIDAELQRRRDVLKTTVSFGLTENDAPVRPESLVPSTGKVVLPVNEEALMTSSIDSARMIPAGPRVSTLSDVVTGIEEPTESSEPPANAGTFSNVASTPQSVQYPTISILLPSKHMTQEKHWCQNEEDEEIIRKGDFGMLTREEQQLMDEFKQALEHQK